MQRTKGQEQPAPSSTDNVCVTLEQADAKNGLPVDFFVRVIWQESRFNAVAVSPKGAQGIAQFMPKTADWRRLSDPFDVSAALVASASYLRDLSERFGNLGLAAAAYNAGPQRVQDWLSARLGLPNETRRYVQIVTGHRLRNGLAARPVRAYRFPSQYLARTWSSPSIIEQRQSPKVL